MAAKSDNVFVGDLPSDIDEMTVKSLFDKCNVVHLKFMPPKTPGGKAAALVRFGTVEEAEWIVDNLNGNIPEGLATPVKVSYANPPGAKGGKDAGKDFGKGAYGKAPWDMGKGKYAAGPYDMGKGKDFGKDFGKGKGKSKQTTDDFITLQNGLLEHNVLPGGKGPMPVENQLFVTGLPISCSDVDLYKLFAPFGAIPARGIKVMTHPDGSCRGDGFVDFVEAVDAFKACEAISSIPMPEGFQLAVRQKTPGKGGGKDGKSKGKDAFKGKGKGKW